MLPLLVNGFKKQLKGPWAKNWKRWWKNISKFFTWVWPVLTIRSEDLTESLSQQRRLSSHLTITVSSLAVPSAAVFQAELIHLIQRIPEKTAGGIYTYFLLY